MFWYISFDITQIEHPSMKLCQERMDDPYYTSIDLSFDLRESKKYSLKSLH